MKMKFALVFLAFSLGITAQSKLDSLYAVWQDQSQADSTRVGAYKDYIWEGFMFSNPDSAFIKAGALFTYAMDRDYVRAKAHGLYIQGVSFHLRGMYNEALTYYQQGLLIYEEIHDQEGIGNCLNATGLIYLYKNNYTRALYYFTQSLKIREAIADQQGVSSALNNIGYIYSNQGDYPKALDYYSRSLKIREANGDQQGIATSLNNIGEIYGDQGDYLKALDNYARGLKIFKEISDQQGISMSLNNMGYIYLQQGDYSKALDYYFQSLMIREEIGDQQGISNSHNNIGNIYKKNGDYSRAIVHCEKGFELANKIGALLEQKEGCECLYEVYKSKGDVNKALQYYELFNTIKDSLNAEETTKNLQQMEFQKQVTLDSLAQAKKDKLLKEAHEEEVQANNKQRNILIGIGSLIFLLAMGLWSRLSFIRKSKAKLQIERDRSENLLLNIFPEEIANELKEKGKSMARDFQMVSILFSDFIGFTEASSKLSAQDLVSEINVCFEAFDGIMGKYGIEKIKTIGDAYMAAGGLPRPSENSLKNTVLAALEMQAFISKRKAEREAIGKHSFEMRVGIHTGSVVAGIVGVKKFQYDIWGDAVNTASRMESNGQVGKVNISKQTYELIKDDKEFTFEKRGKVQAKGKGEIEMYFVKRSVS